MSKMDDLRAMREARYEAARAARPKPPATPTPTPKPAERSTLAVVPEPPEPGPSLCGHRNMSGRTCTREAGHAAKSHRYS